MQYDGDATSYRIDMELFESGELTTTRQLLAGSLLDFKGKPIRDESLDMMLAFLVTDPRRDGELTEFTALLDGKFISYHKDIQIAEWDALGGRAGLGYGGHHERMHFPSTSEPILLYCWWRGPGLRSLTDPYAKESRVCMQLALYLEKNIKKEIYETSRTFTISMINDLQRMHHDACWRSPLLSTGRTRATEANRVRCRRLWRHAGQFCCDASGGTHGEKGYLGIGLNPQGSCST